MTDEQDNFEDLKGITFNAHFYRAATTADGALRISLDLAPKDAQCFVDLIKVQGHDLQVAIVPLPKEFTRGRGRQAI